MQRIRINIFGKSIWVCAGGLPENEREKFYFACKQNNLKPEVALFTPDFLEEINIHREDGKQIRNWKDINDEFQCYGYLPEQRSTIEIKVDGKRLTKFPAHTVLAEGLLFPILETVTEKISLQSEFVLRETLTGLTGVYRFTKTKFDSGLLKFHLSEILFCNKKILLITGVSYNDQILARAEDDAVVISWEM